IVAAFDPIDQPLVTLPAALADAPWDDLDFLAWRVPGEARAFMVVPLPERPVGLVFRFAGGPRGGVCGLCHGIDREGRATVAVVDSGHRPRESLGVHVCAALDCSAGVRDLKFVYRLGETLPVGRRVERLQETVAAFARRVAGLESAARGA